MSVQAEVIEHATEMSGGSMMVWNEQPYIEAVYPVKDKIAAELRNGGKVWTRKVIVVEDWTEVKP